MKNELTKQDIEMMRSELENIRLNIMPGVIEEVKRTRAFGDLSENDEYKTAKREQNRYRSRMRYLEGMIKTARVIDDRSGEGEVGLYDKVGIYIPDDDETETISVVTTVRCDPRRGLISMESPFGQAVLGKKIGDTIHVQVNDSYGYDAVIKSITKGEDDGSAPFMEY